MCASIAFFYSSFKSSRLAEQPESIRISIRQRRKNEPSRTKPAADCVFECIADIDNAFFSLEILCLQSFFSFRTHSFNQTLKMYSCFLLAQRIRALHSNSNAMCVLCIEREMCAICNEIVLLQVFKRTNGLTLEFQEERKTNKTNNDVRRRTVQQPILQPGTIWLWERCGWCSHAWLFLLIIIRLQRQMVLNFFFLSFTNCCIPFAMRCTHTHNRTISSFANLFARSFTPHAQTKLR